MGTGSIAVVAREELEHQHTTAEGLMRQFHGMAFNSFQLAISAEGVHRLGSGKLLARPKARIWWARITVAWLGRQCQLRHRSKYDSAVLPSPCVLDIHRMRRPPNLRNRVYGVPGEFGMPEETSPSRGVQQTLQLGAGRAYHLLLDPTSLKKEHPGPRRTRATAAAAAHGAAPA